jgi:hypothetical protein
MGWKDGAPRVGGGSESTKAPVFVLIQEGGASSEQYIHAHGSREEAEDDRVSCSEDGAYRTSDILEVPASLADLPGFYELAEQLVTAVATIRSPFSADKSAEVAVPESIYSHPSFHGIAEKLLGAVETLGFPPEKVSE